MKNFVFISPNFPSVYKKFVTSLKSVGFRVLGIGDAPYWELDEELKRDLNEYYCVSNLEDLSQTRNALTYFQNKYGHLDYLESNNEYWLINDAILREEFNITTGQWPDDMTKIKRKSAMKDYFKKAGVKVARYILVTTIEQSLKFVSKVGYPVFVKPDIGVGADNSYVLHSYEDLVNFHQKVLNITYIMEEYLEGEIVSFDGIANSQSEALIYLEEHFPIPTAEMVNDGVDDYYYAKSAINIEFETMGRAVVKSFNIKKRCFHIEFFILNVDRPGLADKGEVIAMEVNMRPPGGNTPDLLSFALNRSFYDAYAQIMMNDILLEPFFKNEIIAVASSRKDEFSYELSEEEIFDKYKKNIVESGRYPKSISAVMGDYYFYGKFEDLDSAIQFAEDLRKKSK